MLDVACGEGAFLLAAREVLGPHAAQLYGVDLDGDAIATARRALGGSAELVVGDGLDLAARFPGIAFDAVIGNPPWGAHLSPGERTRYRARFAEVHTRTPDSFNYFLAAAHAALAPGGRLGMVVPSNFLFQHEYARARRHFAERSSLELAVNLGDGVFSANVPSCVVVIAREPSAAATQVIDLRRVARRELPAALASSVAQPLARDELLAAPSCAPFMDPIGGRLVQRLMREHAPLGDWCDQVAAGIGTGGDRIFRIPDAHALELGIEPELLHPALIGRELHPPCVPRATGHSIVYATRHIDRASHPRALAYLAPFERRLSQKRETRLGKTPWWNLHWPRSPALFAAPKIVLRQTASSLIAAVDDVGYFCLNSVIVVRPRAGVSLVALVALLNSKLLRWVYGMVTQEQARAFAEVKPVNLRKLPIIQMNLELEQLAKESPEAFDEGVFRLYGLTASERQRVLNAT